MPTATVALTIRVTNDYAFGPTFTHVLHVDVPAPAADENLTEWAMDELLPTPARSLTIPIWTPSIPSRASVPQPISTTSLVSPSPRWDR